MGHGSQYHRGVGSMGTLRPMRVFKGKKLPGHMGHETVTIQNLEIVAVDAVENVILVKGNIPGPKNSFVIIKTSVKHPGAKNTAAELVSYAKEEVVEVIEENTEASQEVSE
jgi:ribosomal protein L3